MLYINCGYIQNTTPKPEQDKQNCKVAGYIIFNNNEKVQPHLGQALEGANMEQQWGQQNTLWFRKFVTHTLLTATIR